MIRLLTLVHKRRGVSPGQRFRLEQWAPILAERHGISLDFLPFESSRLTEILYQPGHQLEKAYWVLRDTARRADILVRARGYDGVVIYREAALFGPALYEWALARSGVPIFYDYDDAIWIQPPGGVNGVFSKLRFGGKTKTICRVSTTVCPGNEYLADYARKWNDNVEIVPTTIDLGMYPVRPPPKIENGRIVIGWSGSVHTLVHLEYGRVALERLAAKRPITVHVVCNKPPARPFAGAENVFVEWSEAAETDAIAAAHIGIMPVPDDAFSRGKCGLKALQYMATGRPVVISPVGVNSDIVVPGHNGFLAASDDEWVEHLDALAASEALRERLAVNARRTVEARFSAQIGAELFAGAVKRGLKRDGSDPKDAYPKAVAS